MRRARDARGLTIQDISKLTKIPLTALGAIERNDTAQLSDSIFTRGFVRAYAAQVGLDPEEILDEYLAQFDGQPEPEPVEREFDEESEEASISRASWLTVLALGVGVGIYGAMWDTTGQPRPESPSPETTPRATQRFDRVDISASALDSLPGGMQLQIHPRGPCMVSATTDGRQGTPRLLQTGESLTFEGRGEIEVRVDDPGACAYWIDATPGRQRSRPGSTVLIRMVEESEQPVATTGVSALAAARPPSASTLVTRSDDTPMAVPAVAEEIPSATLGEQPIADLGSEMPEPFDSLERAESLSR